MVYALTIDKNVFPAAKFTDVASVLNLILPLLTIFGGIVFMIMMLFGAFTIITAGGDPEKVKKAQKTFSTSILGLFVIIGAYIIIKVIQFLFGLEAIF